MADRNTKIRRGQLGDESVEPIDLEASNGADTGDVPSLGADGQFEWVSLAGGGDMLKSVYDTDDDGIVDKAQTVDDGTTGEAHKSTAEQVRDAVDKKHASGSDDQIASTVPTDETGVSVQDHIDDTGNPHSVTKAQVGLTNVSDDLQLKENISSYPEKVAPVDNDYLLLEDSEETGTPIKKVKKSALGGGLVDSVNGYTGDVDLVASDILTDETGLDIQEALDSLNIKEGFNEGLLSNPTITDASGLNISITSVDVLIRSDVEFPDYLYKFTVPQDTSLGVTDNSVNYIYVDYESGSPIYKATINRDDINNSNHIPVARVYIKDANIEYQVPYEFVGRSASIRIFDRLMRTTGNTGIVRESGLAITESGTRVVNIAEGYVWFGIHRIQLATIVMGETGVISQLWYHSGASWTKADITAYNNTQYDNGTGLSTLTTGRYAVNWIYRNINTEEIDIVLGTGDYTLAQATASMIPPIPTQIANFYVLVGRIIVKKSSDTAYAIENVADVSFRASTVTIHNDLGGLNEGNYVHLTSTEKTNTDDAVTKRHTQGTDTTLGAMSSDINMNSKQLTSLAVPDANGEAIRQTTKITEVNLEDAVDKKHDIQTASTVDTDESGITVQDKLDTIPEADNFTIINTANVIKVADRIEENIMLLAFYRCVDQSKSIYNLIDGFIDEYEDETGIDTVNSLNEAYDSSNDLYSPANETYCKLLLHGDGTDGATTITDETGKTVTNTADQYDSYTKLLWHCDVAHDGSAEAVATTGQTVSFVGTADCVDTQKKWTKSLLLDGDSDYCTVPDSDDWNFGAGDFTIDTWVRFNNLTGYQSLYCQMSADGADFIMFAKWNDNTLKFKVVTTAGGTITEYTSEVISFAIDTWYHIALVRSSSTCYMFVDGVSKSVTEGTAFTTLPDMARVLNIGSNMPAWGHYLNGYIDEFRVSKGIARWTSNFTPPVQPYGRVYISTSQKEFGTASMLFDGSGSYASLADSDDWNFGSGDFTIDCWAKWNDHTTSDGLQIIACQKDSGGGEWFIGSLNATTLVILFKNSDGVQIGNYQCNWTPTDGQWYHLAFERSGATGKIFVNGISQTLREYAAFGTSDVGNLDGDVLIGRYRTYDYYFNGWIDEFRISRGIARWTENFTPPTSAYAYPMKENMTLISNDVTAEAEPTKVRIVVFEEDVDAIIINTDLKLWASIDNGANYDQITMTDEGDWATGKRVLAGIVDVTARTGTAVLYKITTHNNKDCKIHGTACSWN